MNILPAQPPRAPAHPVRQPASHPAMRRRLIAALLVLATGSSILSTLAFLGYLLLPLALHEPRTAFAWLFAVGVAGLGVAEACQILGVLLLLSLWITRTYAPRTLREVVVLLLSLIPYMPVLIFLLTLIVYLRVRRQQPLSPRRRQAAQDLKEQTADTLIDAASNASSSSASAPAPGSPARAVPGQAPAAPPVRVGAVGAQPRPPSTRSRTQESIRRVIGPSTSQAISGPVNGLAAVTMFALLVSTATATTMAVVGGVPVSANGLTSLLRTVAPASPTASPAHGACSSIPKVDPQASSIIGGVRHTTELTDWQTGVLAPQNDLATFSLKQSFNTAILLRTNSAGTLTVKMTFCSDGHDDPTFDDSSSQVPPNLAGTWYLATTWFYDTQRPQDVGRVMQTVLWNGTPVHVSFLTIAATDTPHACPAPAVTAASDFTLSGVRVDAQQVSETGVAYLSFTYVAQSAGTLEFFVCIDGLTFLSSSHQLAAGSDTYQAYQDMIQDPNGGYCATCQDYGAARWIVVWDHHVVAQVPFDVSP